MNILFMLIGLIAILVAAGFGLAELVTLIRTKKTSKKKNVAFIVLTSGILVLGLGISDKTFMAFFLFMSMYGFIVDIVMALAYLIRKNSRTQKKIIIMRVLFWVSFILFTVAISQNASGFFSILQLMLGLMVPIYIVVLIVKLIRKEKSKVTAIFIPVWIVLCIGSGLIGDLAWEKEIQARNQDHEMHDVEIKTETNIEMVDGDTPLVLELTKGFDNTSRINTYKYVLDSSELYRAIDDVNISYEQCIQIISDSKTIDDKFKPYFIDFIERIHNKYPDVNLDILYHNLKTLVVNEVGRSDYFMKSHSTTSSGCYRLDENAIYIPKGTVYKEGEWGFQVLIHEFCHVLRCSWFDANGNHYKLVFGGLESNSLLGESMNSVFSCSLLNYYEKDIAYQIPSNYLRIMIECMGNYNLSDYVNHSDVYFLKKLDEANGHTNYAEKVWQLIALQRKDYEDDSIDIPKEKYYPIYD